MKRAAIYTRISLDRDGTKTSPERQEADCRALCQARGWEVAGVFCDRDLSASNPKVVRPDYDAMLAGVAAGNFDGVVIWKLDRLARNVREALRVSDFLREHGADLASTRDSIDTSTAMGRTFFVIMAALAELEAATTGERVATAEAHNARAGKLHGGGHRCYGYTREGEIEPVEAETLRAAARRLHDGDSLRAIARDMNALGLRTTADKEWTARGLAQTLRSPRLRGYREHKGDLYPGTWEPIFEESEHLALVDLLSEGHRRPTRRGQAHLLTGLAVCSVCGSKMGYGVFKQHNGKPFGRYACKKAPGWPGCGGLAASEKSVDDVVGAQYLDRIRDVALSQPESDPAQEVAAAKALLREDQKALEDLVTERYVARTLSEEHYAKARLALEARIRDTEDALARLAKPTSRRPEWQDPGKVAYVWGIMTVEERREMLRNAIERVVIHRPKRRGGNVFDPSRVEVVWS